MTTVPFFRPQIGEAEIEEVVKALRSGWLTSGPLVKRFEADFAEAVGARYAVAVNSCTAALHLAVEALGLRAGECVLVPSMTFAATAEVVRYLNAVPILVDCDPQTGNIDLEDARRKLQTANGRVAGIIPVHVGGLMIDIARLNAFAAAHGLWIVEDAAHAYPAAWRSSAFAPWQRCGEGTAAVTCYSFYANKTITTGEGGLAATNDPDLAARMRLMSLHGLSKDAWTRYSSNGHTDYQIVAPGFKYNLTDIAAAIGIHQLSRAEAMRQERADLAAWFREQLRRVEEIELPPDPPHRVHAWHLFPIALRLERLRLDRNRFIELMMASGVSCSVHWRPLHLHPYYRETFGYRPEDCPNATARFERSVSLPIFCGMSGAERDRIVDSVISIVAAHRAAKGAAAARHLSSTVS